MLMKQATQGKLNVHKMLRLHKAQFMKNMNEWTK